MRERSDCSLPIAEGLPKYVYAVFIPGLCGSAYSMRFTQKH